MKTTAVALLALLFTLRASTHAADTLPTGRRRLVGHTRKLKAKVQQASMLDDEILDLVGMVQNRRNLATDDR